jgi:hypothetical protein
MSQGERGILEFKYKYLGNYMFHAHKTEFAEKGWMGIFQVVDEPKNQDNNQNNADANINFENVTASRNIDANTTLSVGKDQMDTKHENNLHDNDNSLTNPSAYELNPPTAIDENKSENQSSLYALQFPFSDSKYLNTNARQVVAQTGHQ